MFLIFFINCLITRKYTNNNSKYFLKKITNKKPAMLLAGSFSHKKNVFMQNISDNAQQFRKLITSPSKFKLFLIKKLPLAFIAGVKMVELTEKVCEVKIKYRYLNQNPFRSMYFAAQAMAAELSTGALALMYIYKRNPQVSMLVLNMNASFQKKAIGNIHFKCIEGSHIEETIQNCIDTNEAKTITVTSIGLDEAGDIVAQFQFTWTFKAKKK